MQTKSITRIVKSGLSKVMIVLVFSTVFLSLSIGVNAQPACVTPPSGLVGWWPGDGNADDIWDGNSGTMMNGATFAPGKVGQAFSLDGVNDHVSIPYDPSFNLSSFTLEAWVKFTQNDTLARIISRPSDGNPTDGFSFFTLSNTWGKISGGVQGEGQVYSVSVSTGAFTFADDNWHMASFVRDVVANEIRIYVDGVLYMSYPDSSPGDMDHNFQGIIIGSYDGGKDFFEGLVDEVEIYNRALSAAEIQAIFNAGSAGKCKPLECGDTITTDTTLTSDLLNCPGDGIIIGADGITLDGAGHKIIGSGSGIGIVLNGHNDVTIKNLIVMDFETGISIQDGVGNEVTVNYLTDNDVGLSLVSATDTTVTNNVITNNALGVSVDGASVNNGIFLNLLIDNGDEIHDAGLNIWVHPVHQLGNFWWNYWGEDDGSNGRTAGDGVGDTDLPHEGVDNAPLMDPSIPMQFGELPFGPDWWSRATWLVWRGGWSPVAIQVMNPLGQTISPVENQIGLNAFYAEDDQTEPGTTLVFVLIVTPIPLNPYPVEVFSFQMTALADLTYSMEWFASLGDSLDGVGGEILFERSVEDAPLAAGQTRQVDMLLEESPEGELTVSPVPQYSFSGILQPINPDGSSVFKQRSTIPVKFRLFDAAGVPVSTAHATLESAKISDGVAGDYLEAVSTAKKDVGNVFRYDAEAEQYIFNLGTKGLDAGTYYLRIALDDGQIFTVQVSLR